MAGKKSTKKEVTLKNQTSAKIFDLAMGSKKKPVKKMMGGANMMKKPVKAMMGKSMKTKKK